ncbi:MAG: replication initiator protein A [Verrucomicrobiaceae bacterium]
MDDSKNEQLAFFADTELEIYDKGKDELTFAEFPLGVPGKDSSRTGNSISYTDIIRDSKTGANIKRTVLIEGSETYGLPTYYDEEILFGVLQLTNLQRQGDDWPTQITFTRYHLAKILGLKTDGRTYKRIWDSLHRLTNTTYNFNFSFFDKQDEEWRPSVAINFIQTLQVHGGPVAGRAGEVTITWNENIHRNFQAGYLRNIDFSEYRALKHPLAKALYRYLGKHFHRRSRLKYDLKVLCCEKLGLSRDSQTGHLKQALQPAISKLEQQGFIKPLNPKLRYIKRSVGQWDVIFEKTTTQENLPMEVSPVSVHEAKLIDFGVSKGVASKLVTEFPEEHIAQKIDEFKFLVAQGRGPTKNPGAWLSKSIRESWDPPEDYKSPEEREQVADEKKKKEVATKEAEIEKRQRKVEYMQIQAIREEWVRQTMSSMTPEELKELERSVMGNEEEDGQISQVLAKPLMRAELAERLEREGKIPPLPEVS